MDHALNLGLGSNFPLIEHDSMYSGNVPRGVHMIICHFCSQCTAVESDCVAKMLRIYPETLAGGKGGMPSSTMAQQNRNRLQKCPSPDVLGDQAEYEHGRLMPLPLRASCDTQLVLYDCICCLQTRERQIFLCKLSRLLLL